jgi:iron complex outermembrane recepter protein
MSANFFPNQPGKDSDPHRLHRSFIKRIAVSNVVFFLLLVGGLACCADAQQTDPITSGPLTQLSLEQLGNVEVTTVSKEPEKVWQTPAAIYVLTQEDIRRSGATSIPEVLRLVPGVEVARIDSDHWSIGVRGFGSGFSKSVLVLIDGRSVYTPLYAGVYWDVQDTVLEDIDRIEVIRGPGGTIWGANAVNGVINIITKNARDTHGTLASAIGGGLDQGIGEIRQGGGDGKDFDYRVYGKAFSRGSESDPDPENSHYDEWRQQRGGFRMDWGSDSSNTGSTSNTFTLQGDVYHGEDGDITSVGSFSPPSQITLAGTDDVSGGNLLGRWRHEFAGGSDVQIQTYYDRTDRRAPQYGETRNTFDVDFLYHEKLGRRQDILWGLGIRISPSHFTETIPGLTFTGSHLITDSTYSGFVQDEIHIVERKLSLTIGTKLEHNDFNGFDAQPSARLLWTPDDRQTFWGAVTRAVRTPSLLDTDLQLIEFLGFYPKTTLPVYLQVDGDPTFAPEQLLGYEAGYRRLITSRFYVDFSAFDNQYNDLSSYGKATSSVQTVPLTYLVLSEPFANGIKGATEGFEVAPDWKLTTRWQLKGSYSYLHLRTEDKPGYTDTGTVTSYNGSSPHHEVVVQSLLNLPKRFEADLTYRYVSALPAQAVPAYSTGDVRVSWQSPKNFNLSLVGQNLFEPDHWEFGNTPGPPVGISRAVYAKITWSSTTESHQ